VVKSHAKGNMMNNQHLSSSVSTIDQLDTPFLTLNKTQFLANVTGLKQRLAGMGVSLRPHLKTVRSVAAAQHILSHHSDPITVSTLAEAEAFAAAGYHNQLYAVGIAPSKLDRIAALRDRGTDISLLLDSVEQARFVAEYCRQHHRDLPCLIEIDSDDVRAGIRHDDPQLLKIAQILNQTHPLFRGLLTHAGGSYHCRSAQDITAMAHQEINAVVSAAHQLSQAGFSCEIISVGSTPTAYFAEHFRGITEVRAGVYHFFDLVMADLGVCQLNQIALSVTTTIIGHNQRKGWLIIDAGWTALSSDIGNPNLKGYGMVVDQYGQVHPDLRVAKLSQEHGIIVNVDGNPMLFNDYPIGSRISILPNHACSMATMHDHYIVTEPNSTAFEIWPRISGW
jgi:D-serine deaminase-like pyridoxal phosphate-dependent protein